MLLERRTVALVLASLFLMAALTGCATTQLAPEGVSQPGSPESQATSAPAEPSLSFGGLLKALGGGQFTLDSLLEKLSSSDCAALESALIQTQQTALAQSDGQAAVSEDAQRTAEAIYGMPHHEAVEAAIRLLQRDVPAELRTLAETVYAQHILPMLQWQRINSLYFQGDAALAKAELGRDLEGLGVMQVPGGVEALLRNMRRVNSVVPVMALWMMDNGHAGLVTGEVLLAALGESAEQDEHDAEATARLLGAMPGADMSAAFAQIKEAMDAQRRQSLETQLAKINFFWRMQAEKPAFYAQLVATEGYEYIRQYEAVGQDVRAVLAAGGAFSPELAWTADLLKAYGDGKFVAANPKPGNYVLVADAKNAYYAKKDAELSEEERAEQLGAIRQFLEKRPSYALGCTANPDEAAIIITYRCSFPFYHTYKSQDEQNRTMNVYSFSIQLIATDAVTGKRLAQYSASVRAPRTISITQFTEDYYYDLDDLAAVKRSADSADAFVKKLLPR